MHRIAGDAINIDYWDTDEPSDRGIDGIGLVRDDISHRVRQLADELRTPPLTSR